MPRDTFLNLPEKKRHLIEEAATNEFATHGFDNASINRIVAECQIAKGSFYQYFEDKKDLYLHLTAQITAKKMEYISPVLLNPEVHDLFTLLAEMYRSGLAFAKDNPKAAVIGNQVYRHRDHSIYKDVFSEGMDNAKRFYATFLETAVSNGEIRSDLNTHFIAHLLISMNISIFEYYFEEVKGNTFNMAEVDDDIMDTVNMALDFIKNGISVSTKVAQRS